MTKDKELKAVFIMMQEMKAKISNLESQVKALSETRQDPSECCQHCTVIKAVQEEVQNHIEFNAEEIAKVNSELDLVDKGMDRLFKRTDTLKKLSDSQPQAFSVNRQKPPEFARSSQGQRSKPIQVRWHRAHQVRKERLCYNCRKEGHLAKECNKPNPRLQGLSGPPPPKLKLSDQLKRKSAPEPETNSVEPEISATFGTVIVPVQANGQYTPFVYPNGSSNPMLKNYSWAELNKPVTPYGS